MWEYLLWRPGDDLAPLNRLGDRGWEAVCALSSGEVLLKRPKAQSTG